MTDRIEFKGGTTSSLRQEYVERLKYKKYVDFPGMIDIWYENHGYGVLNDKFEPVVTIEDDATSKEFIGYADGVGALNFVAQAFNELRDSFIDKTNNSTIDFPPYMQGLIPSAGFVSFDDTYASWLTYCSIKYSSFFQNNISIVNYRTFLDSMKTELVKNLKTFPITKSGFCLSSRNDIRTTGLAIDLTDLDPVIDTYKGEIVQSLNFTCFIEEAAHFGFYVDKNVPWRLLANLDSKMMRLYIRGLETNASSKDFDKHFEEQMQKDANHKDLSTMDILGSIYRTKTHLDDLFHLQDFVIKIYNQIVLNVPYYTKMEYRSHDNSYEKVNVFRSGVDFLNTEEWLELLVMVRLLELDSYTELDYTNIVEKCKNVYRSPNLGLRAALSTIGKEMANIIKQQFTNEEKQDIIMANTETDQRRERRNANTTRIIQTPSPSSIRPPSGGSSSGY
jgi:hypothetical protein